MGISRQKVSLVFAKFPSVLWQTGPFWLPIANLRKCILVRAKQSLSLNDCSLYIQSGFDKLLGPAAIIQACTYHIFSKHVDWPRMPLPIAPFNSTTTLRAVGA